jgi:hypothetical protein
MTPSAKKRADQVNARKVAKDERRANITDISKKRDAIESKKVRGSSRLPRHHADRVVCGLYEKVQLPVRSD